MQAPADSPTAEQDMADMVSEMEALLGPDAVVSYRLDIGDAPPEALRRHGWFCAVRA